MKSPEGGPPIFRLNSYYKGGKNIPGRGLYPLPEKYTCIVDYSSTPR